MILDRAFSTKEVTVKPTLKWWPNWLHNLRCLRVGAISSSSSSLLYSAERKKIQEINQSHTPRFWRHLFSNSLVLVPNNIHFHITTIPWCHWSHTHSPDINDVTKTQSITLATPRPSDVWHHYCPSTSAGPYPSYYHSPHPLTSQLPLDFTIKNITSLTLLKPHSRALWHHYYTVMSAEPHLSHNSHNTYWYHNCHSTSLSGTKSPLWNC